jgi:hypothetical protein
MRDDSAEAIAARSPAALKSAREHLRALGLSPAAITRSPSPLALIDLLHDGHTFGNLLGLLIHWARDERVDLAAVRRRLRIVAITRRTHNSPNTWRWFQQLGWARDFPRPALRGVSVEGEFWSYLGDYQDKVARWNPPHLWGADQQATPPREEAHLQALRQAAAIHQRAGASEERHRLASELAALPEMRHAWLRRLVLELRG